jgi:hypothetical protein
MESLSPMGRPSMVKDITDAVMYLTDAATVTGDIPVRRWRLSFRPLVIEWRFRHDHKLNDVRYLDREHGPPIVVCLEACP